MLVPAVQTFPFSERSEDSIKPLVQCTTKYRPSAAIRCLGFGSSTSVLRLLPERSTEAIAIPGATSATKCLHQPCPRYCNAVEHLWQRLKVQMHETHRVNRLRGSTLIFFLCIPYNRSDISNLRTPCCSEMAGRCLSRFQNMLTFRTIS